MVEESFKNPCDWYNTNLLSTVDFVERLKNLNIENYLHITTPEVYGNIKTRIFEDSQKTHLHLMQFLDLQWITICMQFTK